MLRNIHRVLQCCWEEEYIPKEWMEGVVVPIDKEGDVTQISNYRGVTLGSHFGKLFCQILKRRLTTVVEREVHFESVRKGLSRQKQGRKEDSTEESRQLGQTK